MKTLNTIKFGIIVIAILTIASHTTAVAQGKDGGGRLDGSWDTVVTIRNCATGNQIVSFPSVGSFNQGGTFSGITSGASPALRSPEQGVWKHVQSNLYQFRFKAYHFNAAGVAVAYQVVTHDLELDADANSWASSGVSEMFAMNGTPMSAGCSTGAATRIVLD